MSGKRGRPSRPVSGVRSAVLTVLCALALSLTSWLVMASSTSLVELEVCVRASDGHGGTRCLCGATVELRRDETVLQEATDDGLACFRISARGEPWGLAVTMEGGAYLDATRCLRFMSRRRRETVDIVLVPYRPRPSVRIASAGDALQITYPVAHEYLKLLSLRGRVVGAGHCSCSFDESMMVHSFSAESINCDGKPQIEYVCSVPAESFAGVARPWEVSVAAEYTDPWGETPLVVRTDAHID